MLARRTDHDRTSAGIGTQKYLEFLSAEMGGAQCFALEPPKPQLHTQRSFIRRKAVALTRYLTGFDVPFWKDLAAYEREVVRASSSGSIKLIFARGAGMDFTPHFAIVNSRVTIPWIAYYHDPYPLHLYPAPYAHPWSIPGWHAERWHRRVIESASALAFPSARLRNWILKGGLERHRQKAFILPHLSAEIAPPEGEDDAERVDGFDPAHFNITHTGTLLRHRSPWSLIEGCRRFVERKPGRASVTRLWQIGAVDRFLRADSRWAAAKGFDWFRSVESRVPYHQAMNVTMRSVCGVVVEAIAAESPFFPAKLADLLMLNRPVLAVSPALSSVRDILGGNYPLLCPPDDAEAVERALEVLWRNWKAGSLLELAPPEQARASSSPASARKELRRTLDYLGV